MKVVVASLLCVGLAAGARAHSFEPGLLDVREDATGAITVTWAPPLGAQPDALVPHLDAPCRRLDGDALAWHADCGGAGLSGRAIAVRGLDGSRTDVVVRVSTRDGATTTGVLRADADRMVVPRPHDTAVGAVLRSYGALGVAHILGGTDHLLFVLGLMLLVRSLGTLVRTVTAFTVAHSITLALAVLGLVAVPTRSVEVLIALSIVMVATEVVRSPDVPSTVAARAPWVVALAFGLLHGLGFAGALADVGLPPERVPLALVGFNLGVEVGQLAFIAAMLLPLAAFARLAAARPRLRLVPGYLMGVVAATWTLARLERLWLPVVFVLVLAAPAAALRIPGGKVPASDCLAEFQLAGPTTTCTDCDPSCDHDGASDANGSCTFEVSLCVNQRSAECSPGTLSRVRVHPGTALEVPPAACGTLHPLTVKTRGRGTRPGKTNIRVLALTSGKPRRRDRNLLKLVCLPRPAGQACPTTEVHEACVNRNPLRNAYFGDLHVHTTLSFDAHAFDVRTTPDQAYRFAQGDPVSLPPLDANGQGTQTVRLDRPLDFAAVTDHSEFLGEIEACTTPGSPSTIRRRARSTAAQPCPPSSPSA